MRFLLPQLLALYCLLSSSLQAAESVSPSALATITRHGFKPGERVELMVTVHNAVHPYIEFIERPAEVTIHSIRRPQSLHLGGEDLWLFRYSIIASRVGDYELSPIKVRDGSFLIQTNPIPLHVSIRGEAPPLTAIELSRGVNIPLSLGTEILKAFPQPTPKLEPSPTPVDERPWSTKVISKTFNPGK